MQLKHEQIAHISHSLLKNKNLLLCYLFPTSQIISSIFFVQCKSMWSQKLLKSDPSDDLAGIYRLCEETISKQSCL